MKIAVIGLESSGTHWVQSILAQHPNLEVLHFSFPTEIGDKRHYPIIRNYSPDRVIIVCRDITCHLKSVARLGYNSADPDSFPDQDSIDHLRMVALIFGERCHFVSYEGLLIYKDSYIQNIFAKLGIAPFDPQVDYVDGNKKYFKE